MKQESLSVTINAFSSDGNFHQFSAYFLELLGIFLMLLESPQYFQRSPRTHYEYF